MFLCPMFLFFRAKRGKHFLHIISLYLSARSAETFLYTLFSFIFPREAWKMFLNPLYSFVFPREAREKILHPIYLYFSARSAKNMFYTLFFLYFSARSAEKSFYTPCSRSRPEFAGKNCSLQTGVLVC